MWIRHTKLKRLSTTLSIWSSIEYGDIFAKTKNYEELVKKAEEKLINPNNENNRANLYCTNAEYITRVNIHCYRKKVIFIVSKREIQILNTFMLC